jgi:hypothetical protein
MSRRWLRLLGSCGLAASLLAQAGCLSCCHPVPPPAPEQVMACHTVPTCCRSHVYIFLVDGLDPVGFCNFAGLHGYLTSLGYHSTYHGEMYHCFWFRSEICRIHQEDPEARFVLVGHGCGAKMARSMAHDLQADNINVNLMVYVDGNWLGSAAERPSNVERVINLRVPGYLWTTTDQPEADNVQLAANTFSAATDPLTLDLLSHELMLIAMTVPPESHELPTPAPLPDLPTPRPVQRLTTAKRDQWDFLKPSDQLNPDSPIRFPAPVGTAKTATPPTPHTTLKPSDAH